MVRGLRPKAEYTYQVNLATCMDPESKQVIAIEDSGFGVEYNRGPTTTFATSTDGNRINIKVKKFNSCEMNVSNQHQGKIVQKLQNE